jgi:hypothetical protein
MNSFEDRLKQTHVPDISISSHRAQLKQTLATRKPHHSLRTPVAVAGLSVILLLSGLTVIHPSWARDLLNLILINEQTVTTTDGKKIIERTYQATPPLTQDGGVVKIEATAGGQVTSSTTQSEPDAAMLAMRAEAQQQIQNRTAQLYLQQGDMRMYNVMLRDGRRIMYVEGPGTSWSVSQEQ